MIGATITTVDVESPSIAGTRSIRRNDASTRPGGRPLLRDVAAEALTYHKISVSVSLLRRNACQHRHHSIWIPKQAQEIMVVTIGNGVGYIAAASSYHDV